MVVLRVALNSMVFLRACIIVRCRFIGSLRALGEKDTALREARVLRIEKDDLKDQREESYRKLDKVTVKSVNPGVDEHPMQGTLSWDTLGR